MFTSYSNGKTYLLLLKSDEFLRDRAILASLRNFDGMVIGMAKNPALTPHRFLDHVLTADPHNASEALKAVQDFQDQCGLKPKAVIPITEMSLVSASTISEAFNLPFLSAECVKNCRDKVAMKKAFSKFNVSTPAYQSFSTLSELEKASKNFMFPVIIKPTSAAHSVGIRRIDHISGLKEGFLYCKKGVEEISKEWMVDEGHYQIEQYIDSTKEISVEIINHGAERKIIAITDKSLTPPPFFAETGHMVPSVESDNMRVRQLALDSCEALNITHGICHVEIRIDADGTPFVIEVAARPGGDGIMDIVERAYGVNLYDLHIRSYLQILPELSKITTIPTATAAIAFMPPKAGTIIKVNQPTLPSEVVSIYITAKKGDEIKNSLDYEDRLGTIEFFWDGKTSGLSGEHLKIAEQLSDKIFEINAH